MVSHSFSDRCHPSASFGVSLFNEFAAGRNARRTAENVFLVSSQSIIGKGTLAVGGFLVTSFRAKSRNLPCPAVIHVSVKMKIDVFVFRFPAVSRQPLWVCQKDPSAALGMTKRGADGFSLVFRSLPSIRFLQCVPLQRVRSGEECPKDCGERSSRIVSITQAGKAAIREYHLLKKAAKPPREP